MISVVVYGRNDQHGYNMHKRVATSLNAIAELLRGDDEIIFVDYATPNSLPTLPEAIADTLTGNCRSFLRVIRVRPEVHARHVGDRSHLPISEPHARNAGIRRAKKSSRWILNTNTDMIFVPQSPGDGSLASALEGRSEKLFGLPRYEIPEWLWERLDRRSPRENIELIGEWGPKLCLDESMESHPWIGYDAPGDFQLVSRDVMEGISGFDERMIHGWHVDSNLSRRLWLAGHRVTGLEDALAGYHMNHNRVPTLLASSRSKENSIETYYYGVTEAVPPDQEDWGFASEDPEEISIAPARFRELLRSAEVESQGVRHSPGVRVATDQSNRLTYDLRHVVPFVMDSFDTLAPGATAAYLGESETTRSALNNVALQLGVEFADWGEVEPESIDLIVLDCGVPSEQGIRPGTAESKLRALPEKLLEIREHGGELLSAARFCVINGYGTPFAPVLDTFLLQAPTSVSANVGTARLLDREDAPESDVEGALRELEWVLRDKQTPSTGVETSSLVGQTKFVPLAAPEGWTDGWAAPDPYGIRMDADRAAVAVARSAVSGSELFVGVDWVASPLVDLKAVVVARILVDGQQVWEGELDGRRGVARFRCDLEDPAELPGEFLGHLIQFEAESATWRGQGADENRDGPFLRLVDLRVASAERPGVPIGASQVVAEGADLQGVDFGSGWDTIEPDGLWMRMREAALHVHLDDDIDVSRLTLGFVDIRPEGGSCTVRVADGAEQTFELANGENLIELGELTRSQATGTVDVFVSVPKLASPSELNLGDDNRQLGLFLRSVELRDPAAR